MRTSSKVWRRIPTPVMEDWLFLTAIGWGALLIVALGIVTGIAWFGTVTSSTWLAVSAAAPWFAAFVAGYLMHQVLPMMIANGRTRRETGIELAIFGVILVTFITVLITIGFVLERGLYALFDWPLGEIEVRLFTTHRELHLIFVDNLLGLAVWTACGAMLGAAWYRSSNRGVVAVAAAIVLIGITGAAHGFGFTMGPAALLSILIDPPDWGVFATVAMSLAATAVALWLTWLNARDTPLRNRS